MRTTNTVSLLSSIIAASALSAGSLQAATNTEIVNGTEVGHGFPWMTRLNVNIPGVGSFGCGATLIHEQWLLTAAHCVEHNGNKVAPSYIKMGIGINDESDIRYSNVRAKKVVIHPDYVGTNYRVANDIALIQLSKPSSNETVRIITEQEYETLQMDAAASRTGYGDTPLVAMGWGVLDSHLGSPDKLHSVELFKKDDSDCKNSDNYFCAGHPTKINNICSGDSGGPLLSKQTGWVQLGVNSFFTGRACSQDTFTGFAHLAKLRDFIESEIPELADKPDTTPPGNGSGTGNGSGSGSNGSGSNGSGSNGSGSNGSGSNGSGSNGSGSNGSGNGSGAGNGSGSSNGGTDGNGDGSEGAAGTFGILWALGLLPLVRRRRAI